MMIFAGGAFHHKNPRRAPNMAAETIASSRGSTPAYTLGFLNCQNAMTVYDATTRADEPAARPSMPSARFTPFAAPVSITRTHAMKKKPRSIPRGRTNDSSVTTPAWEAPKAKTPATAS